MVKKVDKSHRQNVKQEVNVKVHVSDHHKKPRRRKAVKKHGGSGEGHSQGGYPQTHAFTPVYIQSGEAPHLQQQDNPLLAAIKGIHAQIDSIKNERIAPVATLGHRDYMEYFNGVNPLAKSLPPSKTPVRSDILTGENPLKIHHRQHTDHIPSPTPLTENKAKYVGHGYLNDGHGITAFEGHRPESQSRERSPSVEVLATPNRADFVHRHVNSQPRETSQRRPSEIPVPKKRIYFTKDDGRKGWRYET